MSNHTIFPVQRQPRKHYVFSKKRKITYQKIIIPPSPTTFPKENYPNYSAPLLSLPSPTIDYFYSKK